MCPVGLFFSHRGEVCRHTEGQRTETYRPTVAATDATAQCCLHVGKSYRTQLTWATVPCSEYTGQVLLHLRSMHVETTPILGTT